VTIFTSATHLTR